MRRNLQPIVFLFAVIATTVAAQNQKARPCSAALCAGENCTASIRDCAAELQPADEKLFACKGQYAADFALLEGKLQHSILATVKPAKGTVTKDRHYGTCIVRATSHASERPNGFARNDYSRRQAFNADDSKFFVFAEDGYWHLYDAKTLVYERRLDGLAGDAEPQWHPDDPEKLYFIPNNGGLEINELNVRTLRQARVADFRNRLPWSAAARVWTRSEGSPSADGRYWAMMAETESFQALGLLVYDLQTDTIVSTWDLAQNGADRPDHLSMSPSGEFVVVSWSSGLGTRAYPRDFQSFQLLLNSSEHSDIAVLPNGNDAYVAIDYGSPDGDVFMVELQTGERTVLFPTYLNGGATALHISGKAFAKPGWALFSTYATQGPSNWMSEKLFAVSLESNPRILQLAHHRSRYAGYWTEPHASVNRDFTRILFNSNWSNNSETDVDTYLIELPSGVLDR